MIPQYSDLQYFLKACETLNVSRASERLGLAQSTVSQALQRLEDSVGSKLFIRRKNGLELTRAGETLKLRAEALMDSWKAIVQEAGSLDETPQGHYSIGAHTSVATYTFSKFLPQLLKEHKALRFSLMPSSSGEVLEAVVSSRIDFGFVVNPKPHPDLVIKHLAEDRYTFWRSSPRQNEDVLILNPRVGANDLLFSKSRNKFQFARTIEAESFELIAQLVASGAGVGLLPERVAKLSGLSEVDKTLSVKDSLFLCYRRDRQRGAGSKVIIDAILNTKF